MPGSDGWICAAMRHAACEVLDAGSWYCAIPPCPGVWSNEPTRAAALAALRSALEDWAALGLALGHELPVIVTVAPSSG